MLRRGSKDVVRRSFGLRSFFSVGQLPSPRHNIKDVARHAKSPVGMIIPLGLRNKFPSVAFSSQGSGSSSSSGSSGGGVVESPSVGSSKAFQAPHWRPGDWTCAACNSQCFASTKECYFCGALKHASPKPGGVSSATALAAKRRATPPTPGTSSSSPSLHQGKVGKFQKKNMDKRRLLRDRDDSGGAAAEVAVVDGKVVITEGEVLTSRARQQRYLTAIKACGRDWFRALQILNQMRHDGALHNRSSEHDGGGCDDDDDGEGAAAGGGRRARALPSERRGGVSLHCANAAISACGKAGKWEKALELLESMDGPDALAEACAKKNAATASDLSAGNATRAERRQLERKAATSALPATAWGGNGLTPTAVSYNAAMGALGKSGEWRKSLGVLQAMVTGVHLEGWQPDWRPAAAHAAASPAAAAAAAAASTIATPEDGGSDESAPMTTPTPTPPMCEKPWVPKPTAISFQIALGACEVSGRWREALAVLDALQLFNGGKTPGLIALNACVAACAHPMAAAAAPSSSPPSAVVDSDYGDEGVVEEEDGESDHGAGTFFFSPGGAYAAQLVAGCGPRSSSPPLRALSPLSSTLPYTTDRTAAASSDALLLLLGSSEFEPWRCSLELLRLMHTKQRWGKACVPTVHTVNSALTACAVAGEWEACLEVLGALGADSAPTAAAAAANTKKNKTTTEGDRPFVAVENDDEDEDSDGGGTDEGEFVCRFFGERLGGSVLPNSASAAAVLQGLASAGRADEALSLLRALMAVEVESEVGVGVSTAAGEVATMTSRSRKLVGRAKRAIAAANQKGALVAADAPAFVAVLEVLHAHGRFEEASALMAEARSFEVPRRGGGALGESAANEATVTGKQSFKKLAAPARLFDKLWGLPFLNNQRDGLSKPSANSRDGRGGGSGGGSGGAERGSGGGGRQTQRHERPYNSDDGDDDSSFSATINSSASSPPPPPPPPLSPASPPPKAFVFTSPVLDLREQSLAVAYASVSCLLQDFATGNRQPEHVTVLTSLVQKPSLLPSPLASPSSSPASSPAVVARAEDVRRIVSALQGPVLINPGGTSKFAERAAAAQKQGRVVVTELDLHRWLDKRTRDATMDSHSYDRRDNHRDNRRRHDRER